MAKYRNIPIGVNAIIIKDGKVLLGKRGFNPNKGTWNFVGGFVEPGESLETALAREIKEETGCILINSSYLCSSPDKYYRRDVLTVFFVCQVDRDPEVSKEITEYIWASSIPQNVAFQSSIDAFKKYFSIS